MVRGLAVVTACATCLLMLTCTALCDSGDPTSPASLLKKSDLVVIARPIESVSTKRTRSLQKERGIDVTLRAVETKVRVASVLKGDCGTEIVIEHYEIADVREVVLDKGPKLASFRMKPITINVEGEKRVIPEPYYLLYLRKMKASTYEPVTGYTESQSSVFELVNGLPKGR